MLTLTQKLQPIKTALTSVSSNVGHYRANDATITHIYYQEDGEGNALDSDNIRESQVITGQIHLYAKPADTGKADQIQTALNAGGIAFEFKGAMYEESVNFVHYTWDFEVI